MSSENRAHEKIRVGVLGEFFQVPVRELARIPSFAAREPSDHQGVHALSRPVLPVATLAGAAERVTGELDELGQGVAHGYESSAGLASAGCLHFRGDLFVGGVVAIFVLKCMKACEDLKEPLDRSRTAVAVVGIHILRVSKVDI